MIADGSVFPAALLFSLSSVFPSKPEIRVPPLLRPRLFYVSRTSSYVAEFSRRRSAWHASRKGRKRATVYGSALLVLVLFLDDVLKMV